MLYPGCNLIGSKSKTFKFKICILKIIAKDFATEDK